MEQHVTEDITTVLGGTLSLPDFHLILKGRTLAKVLLSSK